METKLSKAEFNAKRDKHHRVALGLIFILGVLMFAAIFIGGSMGGEAFLRRYVFLIVGGTFSLIFAINQYLNMVFYGWISLFGIRYSRGESPIRYWIAAALLGLFPLAILFIGMSLV